MVCPVIRRSPSSGFTLIEIVVVLFIVGVVISMAAVLTRGVSAAQMRSLTSTRLTAVDAALVQFVQQQHRLPCPADGTQNSANNVNAGTEGARTAAGCTPTGGAYEAGGVVPWRALALSENDVTDGWGHRITYRIDPRLAADAAMDMSGCDAAGSAAVGAAPNYCNPACTASALASCTSPNNFLAGRGVQVRAVSGTVIMDPNAATPPYSGAAYVIISAGESGGGAYLSTGNLSTSTVGDGAEEQKNYASLGYTLNVTYYVDDTVSDVAGNTHFDDIVLRPSVMNVISRAGLGPRVH
jgi:prepilin-type N-terminal cleavage/methylation domain-containing protein